MDLNDSGLYFKTLHHYYEQLQMEMAVTGCQWADFVVFTQTLNLPSLFVERIQFNLEKWAAMEAKLKSFYEQFV